MRIAHVTATFPPYHGGTGTVCYHNALGLARLGHEVTVFTADVPLPPEYEDPDGITVCRLPALFQVGNAPFLPGLLQIKDFDLIHLHHPFIFGAEMIWLVSHIRGIPYVLTHHNDLIGDGLRRHLFNVYTAVSTRLVFGGASKFAVVSLDHTQHCQLAPLFQKRWCDVVEVPNGVDTELFRPGQDGSGVRQQHHIPDDAKVVLFVGGLDRAHHFKGVDYLLHAFEQLDDPAARLLIVGDGDLKDGFVSTAGALGISSRVHFVGAMSHDFLPFYYAASDIVVLPSLPPESFGVVLIEAMACGKPVIASSLPGVRSVVADRVDGLLTNSGDVDDLAHKIRMLLREPGKCEEMGIRGRTKVGTKYAWAKIGTILAQVYEDALCRSV